MKVSQWFICLILCLAVNPLLAAIPTLDLPLKGHHDLDHLFTPAQLKSLQRLSDSLRADRKQEVQIEGHVARSGEDESKVEADLAMGEKIAEAAKRYLLAQGVDAQQVTIISYGSEKPLKKSAKDPSNLRVVIVPLTDTSEGNDVIHDNESEATVD